MSNQKNYFLNLLKSNKRMDGRSILDYRKPIKVEYGYSKTAEGSALVTIGETQVMAGVKVELGTPYPDTPDQGTIMVGAELIPLSSPKFEPGPPSIQAIELARVVDRGLRESKAIDFKKLCIEKGEKAWVILVDIVPLNNAGGLFDAAALAALAAIKDMRFPAIVDDAIDFKQKTDQKLELTQEPLSVTVFKIGKYFIIDPTDEEEDMIDARLTVALAADGTLCAMQKGGDAAITSDDISQMIDIATEKVQELRKAL